MAKKKHFTADEIMQYISWRISLARAEEDYETVNFFRRLGVSVIKTMYEDTRPLTSETLTSAGWESNINLRYPYKQQFRKEGERFNENCADVAFLFFGKNKVSFYYYDDTTDQKTDIRISKNITIGEFNQLLDIVKLSKFQIK